MMRLITCQLALVLSRVFAAVWMDRVKLSNEEMSRVVECIDQSIHYSYLHGTILEISGKYGDGLLALDVDLSEYKLKRNRKRVKSLGQTKTENNGIRPTKSGELRSSGGDKPARRTSSGRTITLKSKSKTRSRSNSIEPAEPVGSPKKVSPVGSGPSSARNSPREEELTKQIESITSHMASGGIMEPLRESPEYEKRSEPTETMPKDEPERDLKSSSKSKSRKKRKEAQKDKEKGKEKEKEKDKEEKSANPITTVTESPSVDSKKKPSPRRGSIRISPRKMEEDQESLQAKVEAASSPHRKTSSEHFRLLDGSRFRRAVEAGQVPDLPTSRFKKSDSENSSAEDHVQDVKRNSSLEKAIRKTKKKEEAAVNSPRGYPERTLRSSNEKDGFTWKNVTSTFKISREELKTSRDSDEIEDDEATDTLMLRAVQKGSVEHLLVLLMSGAEIHPYAIHMICSGNVPNAIEKLKVLLDNGGVVYVNTHDQHGYIPLHYLLQRMNRELQYCLPLLEILARHGADANIKDAYGLPAMFMFLDRVYKTCPEGNLILRLLIRNINPYQCYESGYPILEYCRRESDLQRPSLQYRLAKRIVQEAMTEYDLNPMRIPEYPYYGAALCLE